MATGLAPRWRFDGVSVVCDHAILQLCEGADGACHEVRLGDPSVACDGEVAGGWCVEVGPASGELVAALEASASPPRWTELLERPVAAVARRPAPTPFPWRPVLIALAWILLPLLLAGLVLKATAGRPRLRAGTAALVVLVPPLLLVQHVGLWDALLPALLFALALALGSRGARVRSLFLWSSGLSLVGGELLARLLLPTPATPPPPQQARFELRPEDWDPQCMALYPEVYGSGDTRLRDWDEEPRRVLHLGDSLVFGGEVDATDTFVGRLDAGRAEVEHLNLGVPGTGPDHHLLALRAWLPRVKPQAVVVYVYAGNDLQDIGRDYACCQMGPLVDLATAGLPARCSEPDWWLPPKGVLARSPAPYSLRVAATWSSLAAAVVQDLPRVTSGLERDHHVLSTAAVPPGALIRHRALMQAIADQLRAAGLPGVVVGLPYRRALEVGPDDPAHGWLEGMLANAAAAGLPTLDASPVFSERPPGFWAGGEAWNEHLGPLGHRRLADWLSRELPPDFR